VCREGKHSKQRGDGVPTVAESGMDLPDVGGSNGSTPWGRSG
jgi:hypothetical protein